MSRRSLRPQLNQIRSWVHQGRTDAWIAHQLEVSASELREFRRQHDLSPDDGSEAVTDVDLRDEIEAEIEAAAAEEQKLAEEEESDVGPDEGEGDSGRDGEDSDGDETESDGGEAEGRPRRRRRGRRGSRSEAGNQLEGTFDHGEEGYGLWLDPAVQDLAAYSDNWAGQREVTVTIEADQIVIRRAGSGDSED